VGARLLLVLIPTCVAAFAGTFSGLLAEDSGAAPGGSSFLLGAGAGLVAGGLLLPLTARRRLLSGMVLVVLGAAALLAYAWLRAAAPAYLAASVVCAVVALLFLLAPLVQTVVRVGGTAGVRQPPDLAFAELGDPRRPAGRSRSAGMVEVNGPLQAGARFRIQLSPGEQGKWADGEIREYEPPRRVVFHVVRRGAVLPTTTGYELEASGGGTRVQAWIEARSPWITAWLVRRALQQHLAEILEGLESDIG
jgi:carbon monoxide dehydrogenase subunit G